MAAATNVINLDVGVKRKPMGHRQDIVAECFVLLQNKLSVLVEKFFHKIDDSLFELADHSMDNQTQSTYLNTMRLIRMRKSMVTENFFGHLKHCHDNPRQEQNKLLDRNQNNGLKLVEFMDLEESLAISAAAEKAQALFHHQLYSLYKRLQSLDVLCDEQQEYNPYDPAVICNALKHALYQLELELETKIIVYKLFDKHVISQLAPVYENLNSLLIQHDILPQINYTGVKTKSANTAIKQPEKSKPRVNYAPDPDDFNPETVAYSNDNFYHTLSLLLNHVHGLGTNATVQQLGVTGGEADSQLFSYLNLNAQDIKPNSSANTAANPSPLPLSNLRHQLTQNQVSMSRNDQDTLDIIEMLFNFVMEDKNLPAQFRALIGRLQIPILKIALVDKSFFNKKNHPARLLLNELAHAAIGWNPEVNQEKNDLLLIIEEIIDKIVQSNDGDITVFEQALDNLHGFLKKQIEYFHLIEQRTQQACVGNEKRELAQQLVEQILAEKTLNQNVPAIVQRILFKPWKSYLKLIYLRDGISTDQWSNAIYFIDELLASSITIKNEDSRLKTNTQLPKLLAQLRQGLESIYYAPEEIALLQSELEQYHVQCLDNYVVPVEKVTTASTNCESLSECEGQTMAVIEEITITAPNTEMEPLNTEPVIDDIFSTTAQSLKIGTWLGFIDSQGQTIRAKLAWKSKVSSRYIFINRKGVIAAEKSVYGLAMELRRGTVFILEEIPLLDRAMDAIISALHQQQHS